MGLETVKLAENREQIQEFIKFLLKVIHAMERMIHNPITIHPEAIDLMNSHGIGCLPVAKNNRLVGIITEQNYMTITSRLLKKLHEEREGNEKNSSYLIHKHMNN